MPIYRPTPLPANRVTATMLPAGRSGPSMPQPQPTPSAQTPNPPAAAVLAQGASGGLVASWTTPATDSTHGAATGFNLQFSPSGAATWTIVSGVTSPYALTGVAPGETFDVQIQGSNAAGVSAWSATSSLTTATAVPNATGAPSLTQAAGGGVTVIWASPASDSTHNGATGFNLRHSPSGAATWTTVTGVTSPFMLNGLAAGSAFDIEIQGMNAAGVGAWSASSTLTVTATGPNAPNAPAIASVTPPPDGTTSKLSVVWTAPASDTTHDAATGYNLRYSPSGTGTWTTVSNVTSPLTLTGLTGGSAIDVEVQATNAAVSPGPWSAAVTATTWGAIVVPGNWTAAATQVHGTSVAPNGGLQLVATASPTAVTGAAFAFSTSSSTVPTSGLIEAPVDNVTNGWGQYLNAPATAGTYYVWMLAQGAGGATIGALVTSAITVT